MCQVCKSNHNDPHIHPVEKANAAFCYKDHPETEVRFTPDSNIQLCFIGMIMQCRYRDQTRRTSC